MNIGDHLICKRTIYGPEDIRNSDRNFLIRLYFKIFYSNPFYVKNKKYYINGFFITYVSFVDELPIPTKYLYNVFYTKDEERRMERKNKLKKLKKWSKITK